MRYLLPLTVLIAALLPLPAVSQTEAAGQVPRVGERIRVTTTTLRDLDGRRVDSTRISVMVGTVVAGAALGGLIGAIAGTHDSTYSARRCVDLDIIFGCYRYTSVTRTRRVTDGKQCISPWWRSC